MADPHQVSLHISAPLTDLAWRSGLQNNLILVSLCSSSNELSAVVAISHVHDGQSIGFYSDLPHIMDGGGGIHSKTMHPKCINRKSVCLQLFSWMFLCLGHTSCRQEKQTYECIKPSIGERHIKIGIRTISNPHVNTFFLQQIFQSHGHCFACWTLSRQRGLELSLKRWTKQY